MAQVMAECRGTDPWRVFLVFSVFAFASRTRLILEAPLQRYSTVAWIYKGLVGSDTFDSIPGYASFPARGQHPCAVCDFDFDFPHGVEGGMKDDDEVWTGYHNDEMLR